MEFEDLWTGGHGRKLGSYAVTLVEFVVSFVDSLLGIVPKLGLGFVNLGLMIRRMIKFIKVNE